MAGITFQKVLDTNFKKRYLLILFKIYDIIN